MPWRVHLYSQHQRHEADKDSSQHSIEPHWWDKSLNCWHLPLDMCKEAPSIHPSTHSPTHPSILSQISIFIWVRKYALPYAYQVKVSAEEAHLLSKPKFQLHDDSLNTKLLCRNIHPLVGGTVAILGLLQVRYWEMGWWLMGTLQLTAEGPSESNNNQSNITSSCLGNWWSPPSFGEIIFMFFFPSVLQILFWIRFQSQHVFYCLWTISIKQYQGGLTDGQLYNVKDSWLIIYRSFSFLSQGSLLFLSTIPTHT